MHKLNKQDFIFFWKIVVYIIVTFIAYLFITQHFITDNCEVIKWGLGGWYLCFWYFNFFNVSSICFYLLFLWITIVPFIKRKYLFPNIIVYMAWIITLILIIIYIYTVTPMPRAKYIHGNASYDNARAL